MISNKPTNTYKLSKTFETNNSKEIIKNFFKLIHHLLPETLNEREIIILSTFLSLSHDKFKYDRFSSRSRKKVREVLKEEEGIEMSSFYLNNFITGFRKKGILIRDSDGMLQVIKSIAFPISQMIDNKNTLEINFKLKLND